MALQFDDDTTQRVVVTSDASFEDQNAFTVMGEIYRTSLALDAYIWSKNNIKRAYFEWNDAQKIFFRVNRATNAIASEASLGMSTNTWYNIAFTYDESDGPRIFLSQLPNPLAEIGASNQVVGSGATSNDSGGDLFLGTRSATHARGLGGRIAGFQWFNKRMTLNELILHQRKRIAIVERKIYFELGFNGTNTQPDWSGNGNSGTVTSATVADHVPIIRQPPGIRFSFPIGAGLFTVDVAGATAPSGILVQVPQQLLSGSTTPSGALLEQINQVLAGVTTPAGLLIKKPFHILTGSTTPSGSLVRRVQSILSGAVTPAGAIVLQVQSLLLGAITPVGSLIRQARTAIASVLTPVGSLIKQVRSTLSGSTTPSGVLSNTLIVLLSIAGAISASGALTKKIQALLTGASTPAGSLVKQVATVVAGGLTPAGILIRSTLKSFAGSITSIGALIVQKLLTLLKPDVKLDVILVRSVAVDVSLATTISMDIGLVRTIELDVNLT